MTLIARWAAWFLALAIAAFTLCPIGYRPATGMPADVERAIAFSLLGAAMVAAYPKHRPLAVPLVIVWAAALEAGQYLVPGRHPRLRDFAIKALAAILGAVAVAAIARLRRSR